MRSGGKCPTSAFLSQIYFLPLVRATQISYTRPTNISNSPSLYCRLILGARSPTVLHSQHDHSCVCLVPWDTIHFPSPWILSDNTLRAIILRKQLPQFQASFVFPHGSFITGRWPVEANPECTSVGSPVYNLRPTLSKGNFYLALGLSMSQYRNRRKPSSRRKHKLDHCFLKSILILRKEISPDTTIYICTCHLPSTKDFLSIGAVIIFF